MYLVTSHNIPEDKSAFIMNVLYPTIFPASFMNNVKNADKYECWGTSFNDEGEDYTSHKLFKGNELVDEIKIAGY